MTDSTVTAPAVTNTWAWYSGSKTWPGFDRTNQSNIGAATQGTELDGRSSYTDIQWLDSDRDGVIRDNDRDDGDRNVNRAGPDGYITRDFVQVADGVNDGYRMVHEIGTYQDSTIVTDKGEITVPMDVFVFTDGTYMMRLRDQDIAPDMRPGSFREIRLGTWDGVEYQSSTVEDHDDAFLCFAGDTMIDTAEGPRRVDDLQPGDLVQTLDGGLMPVRWVGRRTVAGQGTLAPVVIAAGAMDNEEPLRVSQQHRMLISGWRAQMVAGEAEVLVAAKHLTNDSTIRIVPCDSVTWVHILFDTHQIVRTAGLWSESFHPGLQGSLAMDEEQRAEILALFPELTRDFANYGPSARMSLRAYEARTLAA